MDSFLKRGCPVDIPLVERLTFTTLPVRPNKNKRGAAFPHRAYPPQLLICLFRVADFGERSRVKGVLANYVRQLSPTKYWCIFRYAVYLSISQVIRLTLSKFSEWLRRIKPEIGFRAVSLFKTPCLYWLLPDRFWLIKEKCVLIWQEFSLQSPRTKRKFWLNVWIQVSSACSVSIEWKQNIACLAPAWNPARGVSMQAARLKNVNLQNQTFRGKSDHGAIKPFVTYKATPRPFCLKSQGAQTFVRGCYSCSHCATEFAQSSNARLNLPDITLNVHVSHKRWLCDFSWFRVLRSRGPCAFVLLREFPLRPVTSAEDAVAANRCECYEESLFLKEHVPLLLVTLWHCRRVTTASCNEQQKPLNLNIILPSLAMWIVKVRIQAVSNNRGIPSLRY